MAIAALQSPPTDFRQLESDLASWLAGGLALDLSGVSTLEAAPGIPLYEIDTEEAMPADPLSAALHTRNRHILYGAGGPCFADLAAGPDREGRLIELVRGEAAEDLNVALLAAEEHARDGDYALRILDVPGCDMSALWLAGPTPKLIQWRGATAEASTAPEIFFARVAAIAAARREAAGGRED